MSQDDLDEPLTWLQTRFQQGWPNDLDVYDGWLKMVSDLTLDLRSITEHFTVLQVKEKFGGLRFYYELPNHLPEIDRQKFRDRVDLAESGSFFVCGTCGTTDDVSQLGMRPVCDTCIGDESEDLAVG